MDSATVKQLIADLPLAAAVTHIVPLQKGFSTEEKFILSVDAVPTYLLRIGRAQDTERRRAEFALLSQLSSCAIPCSVPYYFGEVPQYDVCITLLGWLAGDCANEALPCIDADAQYEIGFQAGEILRWIHNTPLAPPEDFNWPEYRGAKYRRFIAIAREHDLSFEHQAAVEEYVNTHEHLMRGRPVGFLHDDYHPGNLIVSEHRFVGVIDFNRCDWGDSYHDFYKLTHFTAPDFPAFACGQVEGYFGGNVAADFWPLYTLYAAMSLHSDLAWTQRFWPERLEDSYRRNAHICSTHDFKNGLAPKWYGAGG